MRVGYFSFMSHCKITIDGISGRRIVIIRFLWTGVYQPVPVPARTGPYGLAPSFAQEDSLSIFRVLTQRDRLLRVTMCQVGGCLGVLVNVEESRAVLYCTVLDFIIIETMF